MANQEARRKALAMNEPIVEAIKQQISQDPKIPTMVMGDYDATPSDLKSVNRLIKIMAGVMWEAWHTGGELSRTPRRVTQGPEQNPPG